METKLVNLEKLVNAEKPSLNDTTLKKLKTMIVVLQMNDAFQAKLCLDDLKKSTYDTIDYKPAGPI